MKTVKRCAGVFAAICLIAAGCGSDDDEGSDDEASEQTTEETTATPPTDDEGTTAPSGDSQPPADADATEAEAYFAELAGLSGQEREDRLVADCTERGSMIVYSGDTLGEPLAEAFEAEYGIDVELFRANSETVNQRILQESEAGQLGGDIIITDQGAFAVLVNEDIVTPYESDLLADIDPDVAQGDDGWTATHGVVFVAAWNTDLVDESELPEDYSGFADSSWEGRTSVEIGDYDWYATLHKYYVDQGMTEEEVDEMFNQMLAVNAEPTQGHTGASELLAAGQWDVGLTTYSFLNDGFVDDGAPLAYVKSDGSVITPAVAKYVGVGLPRESNNPPCALLWADWNLTGGLDVLADIGILTTSVGDSSLPEDIEVIPVPPEVLAEERAQWEDAFNALVQ